MADLATTRPARSTRDVRWLLGSSGALLGVVLWLECIALGLPGLVGDSSGYHLLPVAAIVGSLVGLTRARALLLWLPVAALALLLVILAYTPLMRGPVAALVRSDSLATRPVGAVIVLSSGITSDGHLKSRAADRLLGGLSLIRQGVARTMIVSREQWGGPYARVTSDEDQRRLISLLERPVRVLVVDSVFSTRDEAVRMYARARPLGITHVAVVTSPTHTRRACATFEKVGFTVTCVPSDSRDIGLKTLYVETDRVRAFQLWLYELVGQAVYRRRGWV